MNFFPKEAKHDLARKADVLLHANIKIYCPQKKDDLPKCKINTEVEANC